MTKILGVLPALPGDIHPETLCSVQRQTVPVNEILILSKRGLGNTFPSRMSEVLNSGLANVNLSAYDYLLRVDGDTYLPPTFLESNIKLNVDVVGYGHAHLIKISTFLQVMDGVFNSQSDDSYLNFKFQSEGALWSYWDVKPVMTRNAGKVHNLKYFYERGQIMWLNGYEPLHVLGSPRWEIRNILAVFGYFASMLRRVKRLDVSKFVFRYQIGKLKGDVARRRRY